MRSLIFQQLRWCYYKGRCPTDRWEKVSHMQSIWLGHQHRSEISFCCLSLMVVIVSSEERSKSNHWGNFLPMFVLQCFISLCPVIADLIQEVRQLVWLKVWRTKEVISLVWSWRAWLSVGWNGRMFLYVMWLSEWTCKSVFGLMERPECSHY